MPLQKNQVLTLTIERLSNDGSGVAHSPDGEAVFVPGTAPGDEADVRIVKDCGRYAFGILDSLFFLFCYIFSRFFLFQWFSACCTES